jgi:DNA-binding response OmpR family regulator
VRHAPIVLMSGLPEAAVAPQIDARDVLRKPFDPEELVARLRRAAQPAAP